MPKLAKRRLNMSILCRFICAHRGSVAYIYPHKVRVFMEYDTPIVVGGVSAQGLRRLMRRLEPAIMHSFFDNKRGYVYMVDIKTAKEICRKYVR